MESPQDEEFGFKRLTLENWLTIDPAWSGVVIAGALAAIATLLPLNIGRRRHAAAIRKLAFKSAIS